MITAKRLRELLHYDPQTGVFHWLVYRQRVRCGTVAGTINNLGYRNICVEGRIYRAGRLAFLYMTDCWPKEVDHKNGVTDDDRWRNLREATRAQNNANVRARVGKAVLSKGVRRSGEKYVALIRPNRKYVYLGTFEREDEAHAAYSAAAKKYFREYARDA